MGLASGHRSQADSAGLAARTPLKFEPSWLQFAARRLSLSSMKEIQVLRVVLLVATFAVSCGKSDSNTGDTASDACTAVTACGGDLTGTWKMENFCFDQPSLSADVMQFCDTAKIAISNSNVTGTLSYKADKTFTQDAMITATATLTLPGTCISAAQLSCTEIESNSNDPASTDATGMLTCTPTPDGGCQCSQEVSDSSQASGTFTVDKSTVTQVNSADGSTDVEDFCVKGKTLYLVQPMTTVAMGSMGDASLTGSLVLAKQ
jgi:hypothetical protein